MDDHTPTRDELREIADFLRHRSMDEAGSAGLMDFYQQNGVTVRVNIPKGVFADDSVPGEQAKFKALLDEHSLDRFVKMASSLADMATVLAEEASDAANAYGNIPSSHDYHMGRAWRTLTDAARLWDSHPEFNQLWAKNGESR